jgi:hypothetical protein
MLPVLKAGPRSLENLDTVLSRGLPGMGLAYATCRAVSGKLSHGTARDALLPFLSPFRLGVHRTTAEPAKRNENGGFIPARSGTADHC